MTENQMPLALRCVEIALIIPDNQAETAQATLRKLGVPVGALERNDVYRFALEPGYEEALLQALARIETIYNPNKHALRLRDEAIPEPGEAWVHEIPHGAETAAAATTRRAGPEGFAPVTIAGRSLPGVHKIERFTAWRLRDGAGAPASAAVVTQALETLLCNSAFQRATTR